MSFVSRVNGICAVIIGTSVLISPHAAVRLTALLGAFCLASLLVVPRLAQTRLMKNGSMAAAVQYVMVSRRQLGLWTAAWFAAHGGLAVFLYFGGLPQLLLQAGRSPVVLLEIVSLGILLLMAATSNAWSRRHIAVWPHIQALVWAIPAMALTSSVLAAQNFTGQWPLLLAAPVLFAAALVAGLSTVMTVKGRHHVTRILCLVAGIAAALAVLVADKY